MRPRLRFDVARARGFGRHPHEIERAAQIALQLPRVADARVRRRVGPDRDHAIERGEPLVVVAELDPPVADDPLQRRVVRTTGGETFGLGGGFGELVPRQQHRSENALDRLIPGTEPQRRTRDLFGAHRQRGVAGDAALPQQDVRERDGRVTVGRVVAQARRHGRRRPLEIGARGRRCDACCGNGRRPVTPALPRCKRCDARDHRHRGDSRGGAARRHHFSVTPAAARQKSRPSNCTPNTFGTSFLSIARR